MLGVWALLFAVWLAATSSLDMASVLSGGVITLALAIIFHRRSSAWARFQVTPRAAIGFLVYLRIFALEVVKANLAMLRHVFARRLAIEPGVVTIRTGLSAPIARLTLANTIALTPGTIVLDMDGERLRVHWIDVQARDVEGATRAIAGPFQKIVKTSFE